MGEDDSLDVVRVGINEVLELLRSAAVEPSVTPAALLCRVQDLLLRCCAGATCVDAFLVNRWFNKLFRFSARKADRGESESGRDTVFYSQAVCDIGDGIAGRAALTGQAQQVRDCSTWRKDAGCDANSNDFLDAYTCGSIVCWPVLDRISVSHTPDDAGLELIDYTRKHEEGVKEMAGLVRSKSHEVDEDSLVIAVLQVHSAGGEMVPVAVKMLRDVGLLLSPILSNVMTRKEEGVLRYEAEAMCSLNSIEPSEVGLLAIVDQIVLAAEHVTGAERVCLFFVDDVANELWVGKSIDFDDARLKVGQGLCGYAARTGQTVNVVNSYEDSRFDSSWDKRTGFVTRSVLCAPIPSAESDFNTLEAPWVRSKIYAKVNECSEQHAASNNRNNTADGVNGSSRVIGTPAKVGLQPGGIGGKSRLIRQNSGSQFPSRDPHPLAVLEMVNKEGGGFFDEPEHKALLRLCTAVECLLRRKAAEVVLLKSGISERSSSRKGHNADVGSSNYAKLERTIMRLYSGSVPADICERQRWLLSTSSAGSNSSLPDGTSRTNGNPRKHVRNGLASTPSLPIHDEDTSTSDLLSSSAVAKESDTDASGTGGVRSHQSIVEDDSELTNLDLDLFDITGDEQLHLVERFYRSLELTERFGISDSKLQSFLRSVKEQYRANPFHNLTHAVSVTQAAFTIVKTTSLKSILRPLDKLALLTAAICHDLDHPGNNNAYEVNTLSPLALQYGDSSVLERHHVHIAFKILLEDGGENNILSGLTRAEFREVRQTMIQAILATDMSRHVEHCAEMSEFAKEAKALRSSGPSLRSNTGRRGSVTLPVAAFSAQGRQDVCGVSKTPDRADTSEAPWQSMKGRSKAVFNDERESKRTRVEARRASFAGGAGIISSMSPESSSRGRTSNRRFSFTPSLDRSALGVHGGDNETRQVFSGDKAEDRLFLIRTILHCADLSGQVMKIRLAREWGKRVMREFQQQADEETRAGLEQTTVASEDPETIMKGQHFFLSRIVKPLWEPFATIFPELSPYVANLDANCDYYQKEAQRIASENVTVDGYSAHQE